MQGRIAKDDGTCGDHRHDRYQFNTYGSGQNKFNNNCTFVHSGLKQFAMALLVLLRANVLPNRVHLKG